MFLEPHHRGQRGGWIEAICGSMFSGKTEELIRRLRRAVIAGQKVGVFKPSTDTRYDNADVISHDRTAFPGIPVKSARTLLKCSDEYDVIGIDEAQFFDNELPDVCEALAQRSKRVIVAGLDMDFKGRPFGPMPDVLAVAEYLTKVHAICAQCGNLATHSYRTVNDSEQVLLGAQDAYEARCRRCFHMGHILPFKKPIKTPPTSNNQQGKLIE